MTAVGDRVELVRSNDEYTRLEKGERGTVRLIDSLGTIHVEWDSGSRLGLVAEDGDEWIVVGERFRIVSAHAFRKVAEVFAADDKDALREYIKGLGYEQPDLSEGYEWLGHFVVTVENDEVFAVREATYVEEEER